MTRPGEFSPATVQRKQIRSEGSIDQLFHDAEIVVCPCGHIAINHHGVDRDPRNGGCFGAGSGHPWSLRTKCRCVRTCDDVIAYPGGERS